MRASYRDTNFGPQLEIRKIRGVCDADAADGFSPAMCQPQTRFDREQMFAELVAIARERIDDPPLRDLTLDLLEANREALLTLPAATHNHHAFVGGWLEHVLSVTRTCVYLADKYDEYYPDMQPRLNKGLVVAGGDPARHRQAARDRRAAARGRVHRGRQLDRPHLARARHRARGGRRASRSTRNCCCGWSTSSSRISGCPSGARPSRR